MSQGACSPLRPDDVPLRSPRGLDLAPEPELKELRRDMEGDTQIDGTVQSSIIGSEPGRTPHGQPFVTQTIASQTSTGDISAARATSSAEIILGEVRKHKRGFALTLAGLIILIGAAAVIWTKFFGSINAAPFRNVKIKPLDIPFTLIDPAQVLDENQKWHRLFDEIIVKQK